MKGEDPLRKKRRNALHLKENGRGSQNCVHKSIESWSYFAERGKSPADFFSKRKEGDL